MREINVQDGEDGDEMVMVMAKGQERYAFVYWPGQEEAVVRAAARWSFNPELRFDLADAAHISRAIASTLDQRCEGS
jgi:hypothetical protein